MIKSQRPFLEKTAIRVVTHINLHPNPLLISDWIILPIENLTAENCQDSLR